MYNPHRQGIYYFNKGFNPRAFVAWVVGWAPQIPGFIADVNTSITVPDACNKMFYLAFPLGFAISFILYYAICRAFPPEGLGEVDAVDYFGTFTDEEGRKKGITEHIDGGSDDEKETGMNVVEVSADKV